MTTETRTDRETAPAAETAGIIAAMRQAVSSGDQPWLAAVLDAIRRWPLAGEQVNGRSYAYLIAGEAFDWLLLAERLCDELDGLVSPDQLEELLFHGRIALEGGEEELRNLLGPAKYRAHLNFLYGVRVEEAVQLAVNEEVCKERLSVIWENGHIDDEVCQRLYGATRTRLLAAFRAEAELPPADRVTLSELNEFTYWLFRYRLRNAEPARMASDTRKGMAMLQRLEAQRSRRNRP